MPTKHLSSQHCENRNKLLQGARQEEKSMADLANETVQMSTLVAIKRLLVSNSMAKIRIN